MAWEIFRAVIVGGIPVAVFTFLVVQWSIASGRMERLSAARDLQVTAGWGDVLWGKLARLLRRQDR